MRDDDALRGEIVRLRRYEERDIAALPLIANDPLVARWMTRAFPHPYTADDAAAWVARCRAEEPANHFAIEVNAALVGGIGIAPLSGDWWHACAEFGYWLGRDHWGRGIATDAARVLSRHALRARGLHRLQAHVAEPNVASVRVLEKAGFSREGLLRDAIVDRANIRWNCLLFSRLATDASRLATDAIDESDHVD